MGRSNRDVGGYRGRRTVTDILKMIAIVLGVLVVLAVAGLLYLQRYVVYTDEGVKLELPPFLQMLRGEDASRAPGGSASLPDPGSLSVVVEPSGSQPEPTPEPPAERVGYALQMPVDRVTSGEAAAGLEQAGAEGLILEMKGQDGKLAWHSGLTLADKAHVNGPQAVNDVLIQWNQGETYTIARVCCFRDDSVPYFRNGLALRRGGNNWRDELGLRWMSPAREEARDYIAALCGELGQLGFDEIVLEQFTFPTSGKLENINRGEGYDPARFSANLEDLLTRVQEAVEPYGTKISLRVESEALEHTELSGLSAPLLDRFAYRFWTGAEGQAALAGMAEIENAGERTVEIVTQAAEDRERFQAVLSEKG